MADLTVYHIPVCPFCQRLEILLSLKERTNDVCFRVVDVTRPRPEWLLAKTRGTTALPIMECADGRVIKESLVILQYLEDLYPERAVAQRDPHRRAVENMLAQMEGEFCAQGYAFVMNQSLEQRDALRAGMLGQYARLNDFLMKHASDGPFLYEEFGWAETVFTPLFMRFWLLEYYEDFDLPKGNQYARVRKWRDASMAHPTAQQVSKEQIVKLYYDYAKGVGNGVLVTGRRRSSFAFEPDWRSRPWPPKNKYDHNATDTELGL